MGQIPQDPRLLLSETAAATSLPGATPPRFLRAASTGWLSGILVFVALGFSCVDLAPWSLAVLPIVVLAAFLAARAVEEWPKVGFPVCILGVGIFVVAAGLFKAGVTWSREWEALGSAGAGMSPLYGTVLAVALGGSFLGVLFLHGDTVWRALSSVRMAVVTLSAVGILSVIGTMVVQRFGAGGLPEPEKDFVEKFMKGQGSIPPNARFIVSPPEITLTVQETEKIDLTGKAFGKGKARQMKMGIEGFREKSLKAMAIEKHVEGRREQLLRLFERLEALGFTNVFRTWWFNSLLLLLFVQVVAVILKRYPWGWMQTGWVVAHVGVLVTLAGCVISDLFLRDGSLGLSPGQTADSFEEATLLDRDGRPSRRDLGYRVKMLGTDQSFYHELQIAFPAVRAGDDILWTQEQLRPGRVLDIRDPETDAAYKVRIVEAYERAGVETVMVSAKSLGREGGVPALKIRYLHLDESDKGVPHPVDEGWLFADGYYTGSVPGYVVQYRRAATAEEAQDLLSGKALEGSGRHGVLRIRIPGVAGAVSVPATPGESVSVEAADGAAWTVTVKEFYGSYMIGRPAPAGPQDEEFPDKPALRIEVRKGEAVAPMIVYGDPDLQAQWESMIRGDQHAQAAGAAVKIGSAPASGASYRFEFRPSRQALVVEGPDGGRSLVIHTRGEAPVASPFSASGASVPLGAQGLLLSLVEAVPDAVPDLRIQPLAQESDDEYLATCIRTLETGVPPPPTVAVARLEITETDRKGTRVRDQWLVAGRRGVVDDRRYESTERISADPDSPARLVILMTETKSAMMFRSAMDVQTLDGKTLADSDGPVRRVVKVNHPLQWGGYAFYQNNFIPESAQGPAASVFRVKYDRGIPTIYTGFVLLTLGVCVMLYVNPMIRRRRAAAAETTAAGSPAREA